MQNTCERWRHAKADQSLRDDAPRALALDDHLVVDQHLHDFFHVERIAFGATHDQIRQRVWTVFDVPQQCIRQRTARRRCKRSDIDALVSRKLGFRRRTRYEEIGPRAAYAKDRDPMTRSREMSDEVDGAFVRPVNVVEQQHHDRGVLAGRTQELDDRMERAIAELPRVIEDARDDGAPGEVEPDQLPDQRNLLLRAIAKDRREPLRELLCRIR